jgi:flagellin
MCIILLRMKRMKSFTFEEFMASILTNIGAISALQTLRAISGQLDETQRHVSSGLRVGQAADNAAYWSIATTMRSDNSALSAVEDALGLGAAKVDTAYAGTSAVVELLKEYRARLVAATESGVDRAKVQTELDQLNDQAESIVRSTSFNGVNWLNTDEASHLSELSSFSTSVTASFVRSATDVSVKKIDVDLRQISMINSGGGGILQKDAFGETAEFGEVMYDTYRHEGHEDHTFYGPMTFGASDTLSFTLVLDRSPVSAGESYDIVIDKALIDDALGTSDGIVRDAVDVRAVLQKAFDDAGAKASAYRTSDADPLVYDVMTLDAYGYTASSVYFENMATTLAGTGRYLGLDSSSSNNHDNMETTATMKFGGPFAISAGSPLTFDIRIGTGATETVTIDRNLINATLGVINGSVTSAEDFAAVYRAAASGFGLAVTASGDTLTFSADQAVYPGYGNAAVDFYISGISGAAAPTLPFDLAEIDIRTDDFSIEEYLSGVNVMLEKAISSAANLGSLQSRIQMQTDFASRLSDSMDRGIGRLVDADMNEASTRLKALQTREQLAIQSLSIANGSSEVLLSLFR